MITAVAAFAISANYMINGAVVKYGGTAHYVSDVDSRFYFCWNRLLTAERRRRDVHGEYGVCSAWQGAEKIPINRIYLFPV